MNCLEFRRVVSVSPHDLGKEADAHRASCASCQAFASRAERTQRPVRAAVRVPVPDDLVAGILMSQAFQHRRERARRRRATLALAACVLLAVAIGVFAVWPHYRQSLLEREVLALVATTDYALENRRAIAPEAVSDAMSPVGYGVRPEIGPVSFAGRCLVRGSLAGHLVVREHSKPVTVFLVPHLDVRGESTFGNAEWSGVMLSSPARGTVVVIAPPDTDLSPIAQRRLAGNDAGVRCATQPRNRS